MKAKFIITLCLALSGADSFGHDQNVHRAITANAEASAYVHSSAYADFLNTISSDFPRLSQPNQPRSATNSIIKGSNNEDFKQDEDPIGGYRSLNHFYDPLDTTTYDKGLSDSPPDRREMVGINSFKWGSVSNSVGYNFPGDIWPLNFGRNVNTSNIWSWPNARGYEWLGLTATNQIQRQTNLDNMFRAVGQVMHLLEDTTQPQHVRNEQHLDSLGKIAWESPIEDWGNANVANLNYGDGSMLDWRGAGFTKLEDFWDRHLYNGSSSAALNADNNENPNGGLNTLGLAEWCNGNFLGARHLYAEYYQTNDIRYYPYPSRNTSTDYKQTSVNLALGIQPLILKNGPQGQAIYLNKTGDGVTFPDQSRFDYFGAKFPHFGMITINDNNVLSNYHNVFIPKAVQYSAGLLDYFFRGTLASTIISNTLQYTTLVINTSGQSFSNGTFYIYEDDTNAVRTLVTQTNLSGTLANNNGITMIFSNATLSTNNLVVVYQGTIGTDPVESGISLAVGALNLVWHSSFEFGAVNSTIEAGNHLPEGWVVDFGDVDLVVGAADGTAYDGNWFVDLNGWVPGGISTDVATIPGQSYTLGFAYARNPGSQDEDIVPQAQILANGNLLGTVAPDDMNDWDTRADLDWHTASYVFTATSALTHLTFQSFDTDGASGVLLDAVSLTPN
ncbi:MAG TPA: DUF642 domain-containing protein [Verrucomicrobiae bacterium]|jgi:hypothetical protein|nr:DUF642 domain-containing protein [Verrucomicrobiae bacterium]